MKTSSTYRILGIDPGTRVTGYGIVEKIGRFGKALTYGCLRPSEKFSLPQKYYFLFQEVKKLIETFQPEAISVETQFVKKNIQSAMKLGMARGVVMVLSAMYNIPLYEYAPKRAKLAVVGTGFASKMQVQAMVQRILQLPPTPLAEDITDALSLAITHMHESSSPLLRGSHV